MKKGSRNRGKINSRPTTTALSPVLPPSSTPAALSMKDVVLVTPASPLSIVAAASASMVFCRGKESFLLKRSARIPTPVNVPSVSNRSVIKKMMITRTIESVKTEGISNSNAIGAIDAGIEKNSSGNFSIPVPQAKSVVKTIERIKAPLYFLSVNKIASARPKSPSRTWLS